MKNVKYSVVIPVYNKSEYIEDCVKSVVNQTYEDLEIILINDGSTDDSLDKCKALAASDKRIHVIDKENSGVSDTRNLGIDRARGDYILFLDADDVWHASLLSCIDKHIGGFDILWFRSCRDIKLLDSTIKNDIGTICNKNYLLKSVIYNQHLIDGCHINFNRVTDYAVKTDILRKNNVRFDKSVKIGEDKLFNFEMLQGIDNFGYTNNYLYYIRTNNKSVMGAYNSKALETNEKMLVAFDDKIATIEDADVKKELKELSECLKYQIVWNSITSDYCHKDNNQPYKVKKQRYEECKKYLSKEYAKHLNEYDRFLHKVFNSRFFFMNIIMKLRLLRGGLFYTSKLLKW